MRSFLFFTALPLLASAWSDHVLLTRATGNATSCEESDKVCGEFCIPSGYTCCPDLEGGCSTSKSFCQEGDNGVYGCCPIGETCIGDGGAQFLDDDSYNPDDDITAASTTSSSSATNTALPAGNGAQSLVLSSSLTIAVVAAGIAALL